MWSLLTLWYGEALSLLDDGRSLNSLTRLLLILLWEGIGLPRYCPVEAQALHAISNDTAGNPHFRPLRMKVLPLYLTFSDTTPAFYYSVRKVEI